MSLRFRVTFATLSLALIAAVLLSAAPAAAQAAPGEAGAAPAPAPASAPASAPAPAIQPPAGASADGTAPTPPAAGPRVLCVFSPSDLAAGREAAAAPARKAGAPACPGGDGRMVIHLGDRLVVRIAGMDDVLGEDDDARPADLRLFLDGVELTGLAPESVQPVAGMAGAADARFGLDRNDENRESWRTLLGPFRMAARDMTVGVGLAGEEEIAGSPGATLFLQPLRQKWLVAYLILLLTIFVVFFFVPMPKGGKLTDSLRDRQAEAPAPGQKKPFSLALCQMAWWFFLVIAAYLFLWMVLGDLDTLTGSVLTLMGIGAGTALGAGVIDSGKQAQAVQANVEAKAAATAATAAAAAANAAAPAVTASTAAPPDPVRQAQLVVATQVRAARATAKLAKAQRGVKKATGPGSSFFSDLLSDANGYSFHRFQMFVWTIILGIIFVISVLKNLTMPEFSETLLGLMGISAGTYLGFKFPEEHQVGEVEELPDGADAA